MKNSTIAETEAEEKHRKASAPRTPQTSIEINVSTKTNTSSQRSLPEKENHTP